MTEEPFQNYPLPDLFFKSRSHQSGWQYLLLGIKDKEPYLLVSGEYGAGKTLLCLRLLRGLSAKRDYFPHAFISTPNSTYFDILKKIGGALGVSPSLSCESSLQREILEVFEAQENPSPFFLVLDDVQDLDAETLHNLRLFANFSCNGKFPFRLLLFAHTSFLRRLKSPALRSLDQRIKRRFHLSSLQPEETKEYIYFRLLSSGARGRPFFDDAAIFRIHEVSAGVPRLINNLCDACLLIGAGEELSVIDERTVRRGEAYLGMTDLEMGHPASVVGQSTPSCMEPESRTSSVFDRQDLKDFQEKDPHGQESTQAGAAMDFTEMPGSDRPDHLEQVVPEWEHGEGRGVAFARNGFFRNRRGRLFFLVLLFVFVFVLGFFWQRSGVGLSSSGSALPDPVDDEIAFWHSQERDAATGRIQGEGEAAPATTSEKSIESVAGEGRALPDRSAARRGRAGGRNPDMEAPEPKREGDGGGGKLPRVESSPQIVRFEDKQYALVLSSCRRKDSAVTVLENRSVNGLEFALGIGQVSYGNGPPWWVVHNGTFPSREAAIAAAKALGDPEALIRRLPYFILEKRYATPDAARERCRTLRLQGLFPFLVEDGEGIGVCLGRYDTLEHAVAQMRTSRVVEDS